MDQKRVWTNKQIAKAHGKSPSWLSKVVSGQIDAPDEIKSRIFEMFNMTTSDLALIFQDEKFYEICQVAITKSKNAEIIKFAVLCQNINQKLRAK